MTEFCRRWKPKIGVVTLVGGQKGQRKDDRPVANGRLILGTQILLLRSTCRCKFGFEEFLLYFEVIA